MPHIMLRPFIIKVSVLGYFPYTWCILNVNRSFHRYAPPHLKIDIEFQLII